MEKLLEFPLQGHPFVELDALLKLAGFCDSGGLAKVAITNGLVTVDGEVELRRRRKVRAGQTVAFEGRTIAVR